MKIKFGDWILDEVKMENEELKYSNLYNIELHSFNMSIQVDETLLADFKKTLEECHNGGIYKLNGNDEKVAEYKVSVRSNSYSGNITNENTVYNYHLSLEEVVNRRIESLKIDMLTLIPYEYEEEEDGGAVIITAKIKLSNEEMELFKAIEDGERYFDVIRYGINNKVIKMRFGKNLWSQHDEFFKVSIVLVQEIYDKKDKKSPSLFQPELSNIMNMLAYEKNLNNELITILLDKNILNEEEVSNLKSKAEQEISKSYRLFYKAKDVDSFK